MQVLLEQSQLLSAETDRTAPGCVPTALVEATVEVRVADAAPTKPAPAKASSSPKTGDLSPLAIGGLALAALLGAGALALSLARRRA